MIDFSWCNVIVDWFGQQGDIKVIVVLVFLDLVTAVAAALRSNVFDGRRLTEFLLRGVLPYVLVYGAFKFVVYALGGEWQAATYLAFAAILATLYTSIKANLKDLGLDLPLPDLKQRDA